MLGQDRPKLAVIVNPVAGGGRAQHIWRAVERRLLPSDLTVEIMLTTHRGHATALTRSALDAGFRTIVAVGGDGTLHEVVNGLFDGNKLRDDVEVGMIPAGTGMDFARNVGIRRGVEAAVRRVLAPRRVRLDVGLSLDDSQHLFVNFAETGIGAAVVARASKYEPPLRGRAAYFLAAMEAFRQQRNLQASVTVDGQTVFEGPMVSVVIANGAYFGGGMKIAPAAVMDDGLADILVLGDLSRGELLTQLWQIYPGVHVHHAKVAWLRGRDVKVEVEGSTSLDLDGELFGGGPYHFALLPGLLPVQL